MKYTKEQLEVRHKQAERQTITNIYEYLDIPATSTAIRRLILPLITELEHIRGEKTGG